MKLLKYLSLSLVVTFSLLIAGISSAHAQNSNSFSVSPPNFDIDGSAGQTVDNTIKIENLSDLPLSLKVKAENFVAYGEGGQVNLTEEDSNYSISDWLKFPIASFTVEARKTYLFQFTLTIPKNVEPGSHYGAVVFSSDPSANQQSGSNTAVVQEIGALVLVRTPGDVTEQGVITSFAPEKMFFTDTGAKLNTLVENTGGVHFKVTGFITVYDLFGNKVQTIELTSRNVLPGSKRLFDQEFTFNGIGYYRANLDMIYGNNAKVLRAETNFFALNLQVSIPITVGLIVIISIYLAFRKRINKAVRVIIKG